MYLCAGVCSFVFVCVCVGVWVWVWVWARGKSHRCLPGAQMAQTLQATKLAHRGQPSLAAPPIQAACRGASPSARARCTPPSLLSQQRCPPPAPRGGCGRPAGAAASRRRSVPGAGMRVRPSGDPEVSLRRRGRAGGRRSGIRSIEVLIENNEWGSLSTGCIMFPPQCDRPSNPI